MSDTQSGSLKQELKLQSIFVRAAPAINQAVQQGKELQHILAEQYSKNEPAKNAGHDANDKCDRPTLLEHQ
jgi:hypothetical protein